VLAFRFAVSSYSITNIHSFIFVYYTLHDGRLWSSFRVFWPRAVLLGYKWILLLYFYELLHWILSHDDCQLIWWLNFHQLHYSHGCCTNSSTFIGKLPNIRLSFFLQRGDNRK
jgi:hypothetical protein